MAKQTEGFRLAFGRRASEFGIVRWSPDGKWIAAAGGSPVFGFRGDGVVWLWAVNSGERVLLEGHRGAISEIAWSPDSRMLASGSSDKTVRLWDAASGRERVTLEGHSNWVVSVAWSPDGGTVASGSDDNTVRLWDAASGREPVVLAGHSNSVNSVAWSPDGGTVASGSDDNTVRLWDAASGRERVVLKGHSESVYSVAWSPDGGTVASGSGDNTVRLWDAASGRERVALEGHSNSVLSVAWSPDGGTVASGSHNTVRLWDAASGRERFALKGHSDSVNSVAWSPDGGTVASGSDDKTVRLWDAASGRERAKLEGHSDFVNSVAWSLDGGTVASGSDDKTVRLWDAASGRERAKLEGHSDFVWSVAWSPDGGTVASGSHDNTVRLWDAASGRERVALAGHSGSVNSVAWSPDGGTVASGSGDETVRLWDAGSGREKVALEGHSNSVLSVAWSPDGGTVASGSDDNTVRLWDAASGRERAKLEAHSDFVLSVAWSPDGGTVASGSYDNTVRLWDAASGRERVVLKGHSKWVNSVAWSPDGGTVASGSGDNTVRLWDAASGRERVALKGHSGSVLSVAWSPDGGTMASGSDDNTVRLWDAASGREQLVLEGHEAPVRLLAWSRDGRMLASCDDRGGVRIWDPATGQLLGVELEGPFRLVPAGLETGQTADWDNGDIVAVNLSPATWLRAFFSDNEAQTVQASAKVVLAGDSNAGKTCLARRLAEGAYVEGQPTTHGMRVWTMDPEKLDARGGAPKGQHREVFLWDLGGQDEYQLVNQLFLHDTRVGLVLFDATRGAVGLKTAEDWNERLCSRASGPMRKLLISSKADQQGLVQERDVEELRQRLGFDRSIAVSAKRDSDGGVAELRRELHESIDWDSLAKVSRPRAFHEIREVVAKARQSGTCVIYLPDLERLLAAQDIRYTQGELETTLRHLAREGQVVDIALSSGDRVVVLRIDAISRYAGSLVQAVRKNPARVPAVAQDHVLSNKMTFPGMDAAERLTSRSEERTVLECVVRLLVERGVCFDHEGLLVFPTLFDDLAQHVGTLPPSAPLYYDFNGPIDNIYAALVARLAVSGEFGPVRLWARYAEFGSEAEGTFGIRRADRSKGRGHLDLILSAGIEESKRQLFRDFVDDHLRSNGVVMLTGLAFACRQCKYELSEDLLRRRLDGGKEDVTCPECEEKYSLFAMAQEPTRESQENLSVLKVDIFARTRRAAAEVVNAMSRPKEATDEPMVVLHLSDLHFTKEMNVDSLLQPLEADLRVVLGRKGLDYLVISGDFADKCDEAGWALAAEFVSQLRAGFGLDALRIVLAPGNHDLERGNQYFNVEWGTAVYDAKGNPTLSGIPSPSDKYNARLHRFRTFYHNLYAARSYAEDPAFQYELRPAEEGLQFLTLNSAWEIDQFHEERASLNNDALSKALRECKKVPLGIAVWHHAAAGDRKIVDTDATKRLADAGFRIVLHGDVHEERDDALHYLDDARRIHVVGSGAFAAARDARPESTPRMYSLLRVHRDFKTIEVERRYQKTAAGAFGAGPGYTIHL